MATSGEICPPKKRARHEVRYQTELNFFTEADKNDFVRQLLIQQLLVNSHTVQYIIIVQIA